jgi:hypothetical protein
VNHLADNMASLDTEQSYIETWFSLIIDVHLECSDTQINVENIRIKLMRSGWKVLCIGQVIGGVSGRVSGGS